MSIYATQWVLRFPAFGDEYDGCEWVEVIGQGVPGHIGTPSPGYGYESGDPFSDFLPPAIAYDEKVDELALRAIVIVREGTKKEGQEYIRPLLVLSGQEYASTPFPVLHARICDALRGNRPQLTMEVFNNGRHLLMFDDGSTQELGFTGLIPDGIRWLATLLGIRKRHR